MSMQQQLTSTWSNNWMAAIPDGTKISEISIPGTHESCARVERQLVKTQCQWFSIIQQLNRGIRFLDIRCKYKADDEAGRTQGIYFPIYHGYDWTTFQEIYFEEVQAQCVAFLSDNPTEFILMNVAQEYDCYNNAGGCSDQFRTKFLELTAPYQAKHWYMKDSVPKIEDCRGRIVLIRAYDPVAHKGWASGIIQGDPGTYHIWPDGANGGGLEWNGFNTDGESHNAIFQTQNGWEKWSGWDKGKKVEDYIDVAQRNAAAGFITLNFASYASDLGPGPNAQGMNVRLQKHLKSYSPGGNWGVVLGVIPMDFIGNTGDAGDSLENLIIEHQAHQLPNTTYQGIAPWLLKASA